MAAQMLTLLTEATIDVKINKFKTLSDTIPVPLKTTKYLHTKIGCTYQDTS